MVLALASVGLTHFMMLSIPLQFINHTTTTDMIVDFRLELASCPLAACPSQNYGVLRLPYTTIGGIGFFNKEDSTRKGGTVQVRTSERIIRAVS